MGYGSVSDVDTTGASALTAGANGLSAGVAASHQMAEHDFNKMKAFKSDILAVGRKCKIEPALIAAIISRESRAGSGLDSKGEGDGGKAFGLMQVDTSPDGGRHPKIGEWNSREHMEYATGVLVDFIKMMNDKPWTTAQKLKGGIAAYNCGPLRVGSSYAEVDKNTTGKDYSNDVVARAQWYKKNGY